MHMKHFLTTSLLAVFALSACIQKIEEPYVDEMEQIEIEAINLTKGMIESDPDTKISVGEETNITNFYWSPKEGVGVYGSRTKNAKFTTTNSTPSQNISLKGSLYLFDSPKYTYYPYNSANNSNPHTAVQSSLPNEQIFDTEKREFSYDFKIGTATSAGWSKYTYSFESPLTYMRFIIDATGSELEGDKLESITLTGPDGCHLSGDFKADLQGKSLVWTETSDDSNAITVTCPNKPVLGAGVTEVIYMVCAPEAVMGGDNYSIVLRTDNHVAVINKSAGKTWLGKTTYKQNLVLANTTMNITSRMSIESFSFSQSNNEGKILGTELYFDGSKTTTRPVNSISLNINQEEAQISGCIPYLFNFKLKPSFTTIGKNVKVYVGEQEILSGVTEVDFSQPVVFCLKAGEDIKKYTVNVHNTGLPIVVLESDGTGQVNWSAAGIKVKAKTADWGEEDKITVYNSDGTINLAEAMCGFRLRGNTTQTFPKKPFAIKLDKKANILNIMPEGTKHKRWCLLANYIDRSLMRNAVTNKLAHLSIDAWQSAGAATGLIWNPSGRFVELVIDGRHVGNYYLCEQIKIDEGRLNISAPYEDVVEDKGEAHLADCGYLMEFDDGYDENFKFITKRGLPCQFKDDINNVILDSLKTKIYDMEQNLKDGKYAEAYKVLDINSYIDHWLIHELAMNNEYKHPKSLYMYMDGDSTLFAGPVWDFDYQTYPNVAGIKKIHGDYSKGTSYPLSINSWMYKNSNDNGSWGGSSSGNNWWENIFGGGSSSTMPSKPDRSDDGNADSPYMWTPLLTKDPVFRERVQERWNILKPYWNTIATHIIAMGEENRISQQYNFEMWALESQDRSSIRNQNNYNWFVEFSGDERIEDWDMVIQNMCNVISERMNALDAMISSGNFVTNAK